MYKILAISGSLRKDSYNTNVLKNAIKLAPENLEIKIADIHDIPLYNEDIESPLPQSVANLKQQIEEADGILFASPEYNYAISGVLKNALDWGSRPSGKSSWKRKIAGLVGATEGNFGTLRAYYDVVKILYGLGMIVPVLSEVPIPNIDEKLDAEGNLTDEKTKAKLVKLLVTMAEWIEKFKSPVNNA